MSEDEARAFTNRMVGLGRDTPSHTTPMGGTHSDVPYKFDEIDPRVMLAMAGVVYHGSKKYRAYNWKGISTEDHLNHALVHIFGYLAKDTQDDHLEHALTRLMMALSVLLDGGTTPC